MGKQTTAAIEVLESRRLLAATPFSLSGPGVFPEDFRVTKFASGVNAPVGMAELSDGSVLAATTPGNYFTSATGQLVRYYDLNHDGVADGSQVLADNLPGQLTDVRIQSNLLFVTSSLVGGGNNPTITILALGSRVYRPLIKLATLTFTFPTPWMHFTYGLATRPTRDKSGSVDLFFNVGSQDDGDTTPPNLTTTITSSDGLFTGIAHPDSLYKLTITPGRRGRLAFSNLTQIAYGLRNAAGIAVQPSTGDLYFEDNGINGPPNGGGDPQLSADELDMIRARYIGSPPSDFGFAHDYISEPSGTRVGSGAVQPLLAYTPVNGSFSEGPQDIAFTPSSWPAGLNDGVVAGFYGQSTYSGNGLVNTQNPVVFYGLDTHQKFDLIGNDVAAIGHPVGLLSTADSLFVADMSADNTFNPAGGAIYQIAANPRIFHVSGVAFTDNNADGVFDSGDTPQRYQQVYVDENNNGVYDPGVDRLTTTDRHGAYGFTLPAGRFSLRQILPRGFVQTTQQEIVVRLGTARHYVQDAPGRNFGSEPAVASPLRG